MPELSHKDMARRAAALQKAARAPSSPGATLHVLPRRPRDAALDPSHSLPTIVRRDRFIGSVSRLMSDDKASVVSAIDSVVVTDDL